jgi:hypothetical protein
VDITSITAAFGSLKAATEIAKFIKDSDLSLDKAETKLKLADLIGALADTKLDVVTIQDKLVAAEVQIKSLEAELEVKRAIRWQEPFYWLEDSSGTEGPFCQHCYDDSKKLVRLQGNGEGYYECKVCKNNYVTSEYRQRDAAFQANAVRAFRRESGY